MFGQRLDINKESFTRMDYEWVEWGIVGQLLRMN